MTKRPNYLASPLERQRQFKIPKQTKINELISLTKQITQTWESLLPEEILTTLMIVQCEAPTMVITTTNHTIANHLNYTYRMLLPLIHQDYPHLQSIQQLKFKVVPNFALKAGSNNEIERNQKVKSVTSRKLSTTTRQNISHLATDVTRHPKLSKALLALIEEE